jgi:hypothetical protein
VSSGSHIQRMDGPWKENRINGRRLKKRLTAPHLAAAGFKAHAQNSIKRGNHRLKSGIRLWLELLKGENCQPLGIYPYFVRVLASVQTQRVVRPKDMLLSTPTEYSRRKGHTGRVNYQFQNLRGPSINKQLAQLDLSEFSGQEELILCRIRRRMKIE